MQTEKYCDEIKALQEKVLAITPTIHVTKKCYVCYVWFCLN